MQCLHTALQPCTAWGIPGLSSAKAWPSQLQSQRCCKHRQPTRQQASNISLGIPGAGDEGQQPVPVNYAPKDRKQLWMAAIKPPMYSVGVVPVLVGAAAAYFDHGLVPWSRVLGLLLGAVCVIAWLNLSNDAFDATTGVDVHKAESVVNLTGNRNGVLLVSKMFLAAGVWLLGSSINAAHDGRVAAMLGAAICCGYMYQGPPFRLSYKGLGEPLCFAAFGPLATTAFYLACSSHDNLAAASAASAATAAVSTTTAGLPTVLSSLLADTTPLVWLLSVVVGITTTVILFCSHWHQIQGDIAAGKMSPLVRLGTERACQVLLAATASPYVIALGAAVAGVCPLPLLLSLVLSLPAAKALLDFAFANHMVPAQIAPLKKYGLKWHMAVAACLAASLAWLGWLQVIVMQFFVQCWAWALCACIGS